MEFRELAIRTGDAAVRICDLNFAHTRCRANITCRSTCTPSTPAMRHTVNRTLVMIALFLILVVFTAFYTYIAYPKGKRTARFTCTPRHVAARCEHFLASGSLIFCHRSGIFERTRKQLCRFARPIVCSRCTFNVHLFTRHWCA